MLKHISFDILYLVYKVITMLFLFLFKNKKCYTINGISITCLAVSEWMVGNGSSEIVFTLADMI